MNSMICGLSLIGPRPAAPLVHQSGHARRIEGRAHKIERRTRVAVLCRGRRDARPVHHMRPEHLVLDLHLVGRQEERPGAVEQLRRDGLGIGVNQTGGLERPAA